MLVGLYGILGLGVLYAYRKELHLYKAVLPRFSLGFGLFVVMVVLDLASNRDDFISFLLAGTAVSQYSYRVYQWVGALEDGVKIVAEGVLLSAAYDCRVIAKELGESQGLSGHTHASGSP